MKMLRSPLLLAKKDEKYRFAKTALFLRASENFIK